MSTKVFNIISALLLLWLTLDLSLDAATISKITKFEDYGKLSKQMKTPEDNLRVFEAVWAQIRVDYNKDRLKKADFYDQLQAFVQSSTADTESKNKTKQATLEFQAKVRTYIEQHESKLLGNVLGMPNINRNNFLVQHCLKLLASYEFSMVKRIFTNAINEIYNQKSTEILSRELLLIYQKDDRITYELMLELQIYLYTKFLQKNDVNDIYNFELAYNFSKLITDPMFEMIDRELRRRVHSVIENMPESLIHLFFSPTFCLSNKLYNFKLYLSLDIIWDINRRGAFVYYDGTLNKQLPVWNTQVTELDNDTALELSFKFLNVNFEQYLYLDANIKNHTNILAGWQAATEAINNAWKVEFWNDALILSQNGLVVCADSTFYDIYRRFVFGVDSKLLDKSANNDCQWLARECD